MIATPQTSLVHFLNSLSSIVSRNFTIDALPGDFLLRCRADAPHESSETHRSGLFGILFAGELHQGTSGKRQIAEESQLMLQENGTILHATDLTEASASALDLACTLALAQHSKLTILHVLTPAIVAHDWKTLLARRTAIERINRLAVPESIETERRIIRGDPVIAILDAAAELHASVIVLGRQARVGLKRVLNYSVAEQVVRRSNRPVVTVSGTCAEHCSPSTRLESIVEEGNEGVAALFAKGKFRRIAVTGG